MRISSLILPLALFASSAAVSQALLQAGMADVEGAQTSALRADQPPVRDAQALAVLQVALTAMGGKLAVTQIADCQAQGSFSRGTTNGTFVWKNSGGEFRYETDTSGSHRLTVSGHGTPYDAVNDKQRPMAYHQSRAMLPLHLPALSLVQPLTNSAFDVRYIGVETVNGSQAIHLRFFDATDKVSRLVSKQDWYFSSSNSLPVRVQYILPDPTDAGRGTSLTADLSNFQPIMGMQVPFAIVQTVDGTQSSVTFSISSMQCNGGVDPSEFDAPTGGGQ